MLASIQTLAPSATISNRPRAFLGRNGLHKLRPPPATATQSRGRSSTARRAIRPAASAPGPESTPEGAMSPSRRRSPSPRGPKPTGVAAPTRVDFEYDAATWANAIKTPTRRGTATKVGEERKTRELIGDTPMVDLSFLSANPCVKIFGKAEFFNPSGSIKDRIANHIISCAEAEGKLRPGGTVVAATSGNTGSAIAMVCAMRGYKYIVITNEKTSKEKRDSMAAYGGQVLVGPSGKPADHPLHYQNMAVTLCKENPDYFDVDQYDNPRNPEAYYLTLGPEIWEQTKGAVTHFVAGGSTGGTISGTGKYLKEMKPEVKVCMPDPKGSVFWDFYKEGVPEEELQPGSYQVEGVGKDSIPGAMNFGVVDEMLQLNCKQSFEMCRRVAAEDGMLIGGSSGLNLSAAVELSKTAAEGSVIVAVMPDSGIKYLSKIFNDEWMVEKGFMDAPTPAKPVCEPEAEKATASVKEQEQLEEFLGTASAKLKECVASGADPSKLLAAISKLEKEV